MDGGPHNLQLQIWGKSTSRPTGLSDSSEELWAVPISGHLEAMRDLGLDAGAGERKLFLGSCGGFHYCTI